MIRIPRVRLVFVITALLALLVVPMAGARTLSSPSLHSSDGGWLGVTLRWVESFLGVHQAGQQGHPGSQAPRNQKDTQVMQPLGGPCIDPQGHPRPCF